MADALQAGVDGSGGTLVLVVDDERALRDLLRRGLVRWGYRVVEASSAEEALEVLDSRGHEVAFVLTDVMMPGMSGFELRGAILQQRPDLPVVLMTGAPHLLQGADVPGPVLLKPFRLEDLRARIQEMLD